MLSDEVLVIGAGPFGLSISAHLRALGVDHRIVGRPMDTWRAHMPPGMKLRSEPYGSDMASPQAGYDVEAYSRLHGLDYVERLGPLWIERFLDYADWYTESLVPEVDDVTVTDVAAVDGVASGCRTPASRRRSPGRSWWPPACCRTRCCPTSCPACRPTSSRIRSTTTT